MPRFSSATVTPWTSSVAADPHFPNQLITTWTEPDENSTSYRLLSYGMQPAGEDDARRAGLTSAVSLYTMFSEPLDLAPESRVRIAGALHNGDFRVIASWEWYRHTQALLERL